MHRCSCSTSRRRRLTPLRRMRSMSSTGAWRQGRHPCSSHTGWPRPASATGSCCCATAASPRRARTKRSLRRAENMQGCMKFRAAGISPAIREGSRHERTLGSEPPRGPAAVSSGSEVLPLYPVFQPDDCDRALYPDLFFHLRSSMP